MNLIEQLNNEASEERTLENYIKNNFVEISDFFSYQRYEDLLKHKDSFRRFIRDHHVVLRQLDITDKTNLSFLILLFQYAEMLGLLGEFKILHNILKNYHTVYGNRLQAAALYLLGIRDTNDFITIYDSFLEKLSIAYSEEEDAEDNVIATFVNYYAQIINNFGQFNQAFVLSVKNMIWESIAQNNYFFLRHNVITDILEIDIIPFQEAYSRIKSVLDDYLNRGIRPLTPATEEFLIEENTKYAELLENTTPSFSAIRQISVDKFNSFSNRDEIFYSMQRGVRILNREEQLFAYMNSYGNMHYTKIKSATEFLPQNIFTQEIHVVDWGCGQGLATIAYLDFIKAKNYNSNLVTTVTLIEPSEIALKRAALHLKKMNNSINITTVNKDLDSLEKEDLTIYNNEITLHIFSNILDVDSFSMRQLLVLLQNTVHEENYFICVSPNINTQKNMRVDSFVNAFLYRQTFKLLGTVTDQKDEWIKDWSRIIRVFKT